MLITVLITFPQSCVRTYRRLLLLLKYLSVGLAMSRVQEQSRVFNEELRVLVLRAVIGVGIDDQLRIRDILLHDERVDRGHDHVVTAIYDECRLRDRLQIVVGPRSLAPHFSIASTW